MFKRWLFGDGLEYWVLNGERERKHEQVGALTFSEDGEHYYYIAEDNGKSRLIVDGARGKTYDDISSVRIRRESPLTLRYIAYEGDKIFMVEEVID